MDSSSRNTLQRWLALVVRYWAVNMSKIHARGSNWPGFGYTGDEKRELRAIAEEVPGSEFSWFIAVNTVVAIAVFAVIVTAGMYCLIAVIGGEQNMPHTPESLFFLSLALECIVSLVVGLPAAMLPSAALVGRWHKVPDSALPGPAATAHYFHKLWFQITRMALVMVGLVMPLWLFVPNDSKVMVLLRLVVPLLSPLVSILTVGYYFSARVSREEQHDAGRG